MNQTAETAGVETTAKEVKPGNDGKKKKMGLSLRMKSILLSAIMILLTATVTVVVALPSIRGEISEAMRNYMFDLAEAEGEVLDLEVYSYGVNVGLASQKLEEMFKDVAVKGVNGSYAYIVDSDGKLCYHPEAEKIGQQADSDVIQAIVAKLQKGETVESDFVSYEYEGEQKYAAYHVNPRGTFVFVLTADEKEIMAPVNYVMLVMIISGVIALVICLVIAFIGFRIMFAPLNKITSIISRMKHLDFARTGQLNKLVDARDEIGKMARSVRELQDQLGVVVGELQNESQRLFKSSDSLTGNAKRTAESIGQVTNAVHDMASGASSQAEDTQTATDSVLVIGEMVQETNKEVVQLRENARVMNESSTAADKTLKELEDINAQVKESITQIYEQTKTTNESAIKIQDAIELITSIAEETNLLSLNASIEAARAGEQGKGFAVVANQIQKLAEQSNESAMKVQEITNSLMEDSKKAVKTMDQVKEVMDSQVEKVDLTGSMFAKVKEEIDRSMEGITNIYEKIENLDSERVNVVDVVQSLTAVAEENAAGTEEASVSLEEVNAVVNNISGGAKELYDVAQVIEEHMGKFTV